MTFINISENRWKNEGESWRFEDEKKENRKSQYTVRERKNYTKVYYTVVYKKYLLKINF